MRLIALIVNSGHISPIVAPSTLQASNSAAEAARQEAEGRKWLKGFQALYEASRRTA